jgi:mRNA-degrading endonuclease RelE of RelBE toxin-antitoxin system
VPLNLKITTTPRKYFSSLDRTTQSRITNKLQEIANNPTDTRLSKPLEGSSKRTAPQE